MAVRRLTQLGKVFRGRRADVFVLQLDGLVSIERTARLAWHVHAKFTKVLPDGRDARVDHDTAIALLRGVGYKGCVSVEYEGDEPGMTAVPRALGYLRGLMHK